MLTAQTLPQMGWTLVLDDYFKPFEIEELSAQIRALSRRSLAKQPVLSCGDLQLDQDAK